MFVLTNATLKMRGLAFFLLLSVKMFSQPIDCCPDAPSVSTGQYILKTNCVALLTGSWFASGSSTVERTGFDTSPDSTFSSFQRFETGSSRTVFKMELATSPQFRYYRAFAANNTDTSFGEVVALIPEDYNGNVYDEVVIGGQTWLVQNLRSTYYQNGDTIPRAVSNTDWLSPSPCDTVRIGNPPDLGLYTVVDGDSLNTEVYGLLYNWWVAWDARNACPCGYRPPTQQDFQTLENFVGGNSGSLKSTNNWNAPNTGATNSSGFTALPSGYRLQWNRNSDGCYTSTLIGAFGTVADFWTSTEGADNRNGGRFAMNHNSTTIYSTEHRKIGGRSIRCIRE